MIDAKDPPPPGIYMGDWDIHVTACAADPCRLSRDRLSEPRCPASHSMTIWNLDLCPRHAQPAHPLLSLLTSQQLVPMPTIPLRKGRPTASRCHCSHMPSSCGPEVEVAPKEMTPPGIEKLDATGSRVGASTNGHFLTRLGALLNSLPSK